MFDANLNKVFIGFRTDGIGSSVVLFFHIESDTDILARFMIKFLVQRVGQTENYSTAARCLSLD